MVDKAADVFQSSMTATTAVTASTMCSTLRRPRRLGADGTGFLHLPPDVAGPVHDLAAKLDVTRFTTKSCQGYTKAKVGTFIVPQFNFRKLLFVSSN